MKNQNNAISIKIMDREYKVKCPPEKLTDLQESGQYLDSKMREVRESSKVLSPDRVAVIAALNIAHELLTQQKQRHAYIDNINQRIESLQQKIEFALAQEEENIA